MPKSRARLEREAKELGDDQEAIFLNSLSGLTKSALTCRDQGHVWRKTKPLTRIDTTRDADARPRRGQAVYAQREFTCTRCTKVKVEAYSISTRGGHTILERLGTSYTKVSGYDLVGVGKGANRNNDLLRGYIFEQEAKEELES